MELKDIDADLYTESDEVFVPSDYAFSGSLELLNQLYGLLGQSFLRGFCSVDSQGGINLIWKAHQVDQEIRFKFPTSQQSEKSFYYRQGKNSQLIKSPSLEQIYQFLINLSTDK